MVEKDVYGEDGEKIMTKRRLQLTGEVNIAATLFTNPQRVSGGVPRSFLVLMDYMIAFRYNQSDCERVGRSMTLTKTILRTSLGDLHFKQCVWIAHNSPGFHEVDLKAFVRRWVADGHRTACMKKPGTRAKEVLRRKAAEHKHSFLSIRNKGS